MGWEAAGLRLADVSRGHASYWHSCHLRSSFHLSAGIDRRIPHCFVIWPRWWISGTHTRTRIKETLEQTRTRSLWTHTFAHISSRPCCCCHLPFGSISVAFPNLPTYYFTRPQPAEEISSRAVNGILTCKSHVGLNPQASQTFENRTWDADTTHTRSWFMCDVTCNHHIFWASTFHEIADHYVTCAAHF